MKKIYLTLLLGFFCGLIMAQDLPLLDFHPYASNQAGAGLGGVSSINACYTSLDGGGKNSPTRMALSGSTGFGNTATFGGFQIGQEQVAAISKINARASYVFRKKFGNNGTLSLGLSGLFYQYGINQSLIHADKNDEVFASAEHGNWFDCGAGILYQFKLFPMSNYVHQFLVGADADNLFQKSTDWLANDFTQRNLRYYRGLFGYTVGASPKEGQYFSIKWQTTASITSYSFNTLSYDVSSRLLFGNSFWIGGGYLSQGMAKGMFGFTFQNFSFGYSGGYQVGSKIYGYPIPLHLLFVGIALKTDQSTD